MSIGSMFTLPKEIVDAVCEAWGITKNDLYNDVRYPRVVQARHVVFFVIRQLTPLSYPEIAREFRRDHTTVIYGYRKIAERLPTDEELRTKVTTVVAYIQERHQQWQTTNSARSMTSSERRPA